MTVVIPLSLHLPLSPSFFPPFCPSLSLLSSLPFSFPPCHTLSFFLSLSLQLEVWSWVQVAYSITLYCICWSRVSCWTRSSPIPARVSSQLVSVYWVLRTLPLHSQQRFYTLSYILAFSSFSASSWFLSQLVLLLLEKSLTNYWITWCWKQGFMRRMKSSPILSQGHPKSAAASVGMADK